jgi:MFS family permease
MFFFPSMAAYLTDIAPAARRGKYMGLSQMVMGLAFMLGPWGGMLVLARFGGKILWTAMFLLGAGAAAIMSRLDEPGHAPEAPAVPAPTAATSAEP